MLAGFVHVPSAGAVPEGPVVPIVQPRAAETAALFVALLAQLYHHYARARVIQGILDNYRIHTGRQAAWARAQAGGRIERHFLPP